MCCDVEYLDLHLSFSFFSFVFVYCWQFVFHFFTQWLLIWLVRCIHKFFDLYLWFFYVKKHVEKFCMFDFFLICFGVLDLILIFMNFNFFPWLFYAQFMVFLFLFAFRVTALITRATFSGYQNLWFFLLILKHLYHMNILFYIHIKLTCLTA
jgi:hypothetical protein